MQGIPTMDRGLKLEKVGPSFSSYKSELKQRER